MSRLFPVLILTVLAGCATTLVSPIPEGYEGPLAWVSDSWQQESRGKGAFFVLEEVDGRPIRNAADASRAASQGTGMNLNSRPSGRDIPAKPLKVKLLGTHMTGAPIHEIAARIAGTFYSVEGVVDFSPQPDHVYKVMGQLQKEQSCVWIVDSEESVVTDKVCTSK
jgi:hypothetical protein